MGNRKPKKRSKPNTGRAQPQPALVLAKTLEGINDPLMETRGNIRNSWGGFEEAELRATDFSKKSSRISILAVRAGNVGLDQLIELEAKISAGQRRDLKYDHKSVPGFPNMNHQNYDQEAWADVEDAGNLIVVGGLISQLPTASGQRSQFGFKTTHWGLAIPEHHEPGSPLALPQV